MNVNYTKMRYANLYNWKFIIIFASVKQQMTAK